MNFSERILKTISLILAGLVISNSVLAYAPEANIWKERRSALSKTPETQSQATFTIPPFKDGASAENWIRSIPVQYGSLRSGLSAKNADVLVLHIQDVHRNAEAQHNISRTLESLVKNHQVDLVALEGAFGPVDLSIFKSFPHQPSLWNVSESFLTQNKISGPIHSFLKSNSAFPAIVGIDDHSAYDANVEAYRRSADQITEIKKLLSVRIADLQKEKSRLYHPALLKFDRQAQAFHAGKLGMAEFLSSFSGARSLNAETFLSAARLEKTMDYKRVESERSQILEKLVQKLNDKENSNLVAASQAFRLGQIRHEDFYPYLKNLCSRKGIDLTGTPNFSGYLQYVMLSQGIDQDSLNREVQRFENETFGALAETEAEKELVSRSRRLMLTGKLADFSLSKYEWDEYKKQKNSNPDLNLSSFEDFYRAAEVRDRAMADNLAQAIQTHHAKRIVLVTGGFHSFGIGSQLTSHNAQLSVLSFVPKITKVDLAEGSAYLSVFAQKNTPLDKIFAGEKLFLAQPPISEGGRRELATTAAAEALRAGVASTSLLQSWLERATGWKLNSLSMSKGIAKLSGVEPIGSGETQKFKMTLQAREGNHEWKASLPSDAMTFDHETARYVGIKLNALAQIILWSGVALAGLKTFHFISMSGYVLALIFYAGWRLDSRAVNDLLRLAFSVQRNEEHGLDKGEFGVLAPLLKAKDATWGSRRTIYTHQGELRTNKSLLSRLEPIQQYRLWIHEMFHLKAPRFFSRSEIGANLFTVLPGLFFEIGILIIVHYYLGVHTFWMFGLMLAATLIVRETISYVAIQMSTPDIYSSRRRLQMKKKKMEELIANGEPHLAALNAKNRIQHYIPAIRSLILKLELSSKLANSLEEPLDSENYFVNQPIYLALHELSVRRNYVFSNSTAIVDLIDLCFLHDVALHVERIKKLELYESTREFERVIRKGYRVFDSSILGRINPNLQPWSWTIFLEGSMKYLGNIRRALKGTGSFYFLSQPGELLQEFGNVMAFYIQRSRILQKLEFRALERKHFLAGVIKTAYQKRFQFPTDVKPASNLLVDFDYTLDEPQDFVSLLSAMRSVQWPEFKIQKESGYKYWNNDAVTIGVSVNFNPDNIGLLKYLGESTEANIIFILEKGIDEEGDLVCGSGVILHDGAYYHVSFGNPPPIDVVVDWDEELEFLRKAGLPVPTLTLEENRPGNTVLKTALDLGRVFKAERDAFHHETPPQSLTGTWGGPWIYGILMPLLEESLRWATGLPFASSWWWTVFGFSVVHAWGHLFTDVQEGLDSQLKNPGILFFERLRSRILHSIIFGSFFLIPSLFGFDSSSALSILPAFGIHAAK